MTEQIPFIWPLIFVLTVLAAFCLFAYALNLYAPEARSRSFRIWTGLIAWLILQAVITAAGVYAGYPEALPPQILRWGILPPLLLIAALFISAPGRRFLDGLPLAGLTWVHVIRIPVELCLYGLALHKAVPELMTFEGRNLDILSGLSAPFVAYFGITKKRMKSGFLLLWNVFCLALLLNVVTIAFLSAPTPLQQLAFDQPNRAILYIPYSWLPTFLVPMVLFCHLVSIRRILISR